MGPSNKPPPGVDAEPFPGMLVPSEGPSVCEQKKSPAPSVAHLFHGVEPHAPPPVAAGQSAGVHPSPMVDHRKYNLPPTAPSPSPQGFHVGQQHAPPPIPQPEAMKTSPVANEHMLHEPDATFILHPDHHMFNGVPVSPYYPNFPQPTPQPNLNPNTNGGWTTDLFGCCQDDPNVAVITLLAPCVTFGQISEIIDGGQSTCATNGVLYTAVSLTAMPWLISCGYRARLRSTYGLVEAPGPDWLVHCLCEACALCQEYRELKRRGLDPAIGWHGNQRQMMYQQSWVMATPTTPVVQQRMV